MRALLRYERHVRTPLAALVLAGVLAAPAAATDTSDPGMPCPGTYLLFGDQRPIFRHGTPPAIDAVVIGDEGVSVRSGCAPVVPRVERKPGKLILHAKWRKCGTAKRVRAQVVLDTACHRLSARVRARRPKMRRFVFAAPGECGDGLVDRDGGEGCDPPGVGLCGAGCLVIDAVPGSCGDGRLDAGEECDDGNRDDGDACTNACRRQCETQDFASTWEAIQTLVFVRHGCTSSLCHGGSPPQAGLDLRPAVAHANLVGVQATADPTWRRVVPGDDVASLLYRKLKAGVTGVDDVPGAPMPALGAPLDAGGLEAVRLWIRAGASPTAVVEGTSTLLDACLGPPTPAKTEPPAPPPPSEGVQLYAPPWTIPPHGESEVCFSTVYDVEAQIRAARPDALIPCPPEWGGQTRTCFTYGTTDLTQDPNSHHTLIRAYRGAAPAIDPGFGPYTCHGGTQDGEPCDPLRPGVAAPAGADCGARSACAGHVLRTVACIGYGPGDFGFSATVSGTPNAPTIAGSQAPHSRQPLPAGVYRVLPVRGVMVWNSHAFNTTGLPTSNEQWLNLHFVGPVDRRYPAIDLANDTSIFDMTVPPFRSQEICRDHLFPQGTRLFELSSHTHKRGVLFRVWDADGNLVYTSTDYSAPAVVRFDPPVALDGRDFAARTYRFCSRYDNGETDPAAVKRQSTSPPGLIGGPCHDSEVVCLAGPQRGEPCGGDDRRCDSAAGAGDGLCDACTVRGGVTTEDEMFILIGAYYLAR